MVKHWLKQHFYLNIADVTWKFWSSNLLIKNFLWNQHSIVKKRCFCKSYELYETQFSVPYMHYIKHCYSFKFLMIIYSKILLLIWIKLTFFIVSHKRVPHLMNVKSIFIGQIERFEYIIKSLSINPKIRIFQAIIN